MLPARERADAPDRAVDGAQPRAVALPPDQALVVGRGDLAAMLEQTAVGIGRNPGRNPEKSGVS